MVEQRRRCLAITSGGKPCAIVPPAGRAYCLHHDPDRHQEAREARRRGGYNRASRRRAAKLLKYGVRTLADLEEELMLSACEVKYGSNPDDPDSPRLDVAVARAQGALIGVLRHVALATEYERIINELREQVAALIAEKDRAGADDLQTA